MDIINLLHQIIYNVQQVKVHLFDHKYNNILQIVATGLCGIIISKYQSSTINSKKLTYLLYTI